MNKYKSNKRFWIAMSPVIGLFVIVAAYMIYAYQKDLYKDFQNRGGLLLSEQEMEEAQLPDSEVKTALEAVAVVREKTEILQEISDGKKRNEGNPEYGWEIISLKDENLKDWKVTFKEKEIKPAVICQAEVQATSATVTSFECMEKLSSY